MIEKWDRSARDLISLAGNMAARRKRAKLGVPRGTFVHDVEITVKDVRDAYALIVGECGWQGGHTAALSRRLATLADRENISEHDIYEAIKR